MFLPEPEGFLNAKELESWRYIQARLDALIDNPEAHSLNESIAVHFDKYVTLAGIYDTHGLHKTLDILINPATGSIFYEPVEIELEA